MNFKCWIAKVNDILFADTGFVLSDLPDEPFRDYYEDRLQPHNVVNIMKVRNYELVWNARSN